MQSGQTREIGLRPFGEHPRECFGVDTMEDIIDGIMAGNAVGKFEILTQPRFLHVGPFLNGCNAFHAAYRSAKQDEENVSELVKPELAFSTRVFDIFKMWTRI